MGTGVHDGRPPVPKSRAAQARQQQPGSGEPQHAPWVCVVGAMHASGQGPLSSSVTPRGRSVPNPGWWPLALGTRRERRLAVRRWGCPRRLPSIDPVRMNGGLDWVRSRRPSSQPAAAPVHEISGRSASSSAPPPRLAIIWGSGGGGRRRRGGASCVHESRALELSALDTPPDTIKRDRSGRPLDPAAAWGNCEPRPARP